MRRFALVLLLVFSFPVMMMSQEERIYSHHSDILVDTSGVIQVSEKIRVYADGDLFKRGITRSLPLTRTDAEGKKVKIRYDIVGVSKNGDSESFFTETEGGFLVIYVGSKDKLLPPGFYDYEIVYKSAGQIGFYEDFDELGWNVNGESEKPVDLVSCEIRLPDGATILSHRCYSGAYRDSEENCNSESISDGVLKASATHLEPYEMMTVYVGFEKGFVHEPVIKETLLSKFISLLDRIGLQLMNVILIVPLFFYYYSTWRKHGVNPPKPVVIPQFEPPHNLSPASVGVISDEWYDPGLATTSIINLAVKGFLRIEEIERKGIFKFDKKQYRLIKLKDSSDSLPSEEKVILRHLFADNDEFVLDNKYNSNVESMVSSYKSNLELQHDATLKEGRNLKYRVLPWFVLIVYIVLLFFYGRNEPMEFFVFLFGIMLPVFMGIVTVYMLYSAIVKKKPKRLISISLSIAIVAGVVGAFIYFPINRLSSNAISLLIGMPLVLIGHMVYSRIIVRPSEKKLQMQADIEGLKMYISLAEEKQLQYFNPPEITPEVFERLLPYAIALKVDKIWGDKFENMLIKSMQTRDAYVPVWYGGAAMRPVSLGSNLRQSLASNIIHSSVNPRSTGGNNWGSGSFGGGSVGGGGGGGRTGGW